MSADLPNSQAAPRPLSEAPAALLRGIKLLATDVDGSMTIAHEIPSRVVAAVEALTAAGVEVVPATGRPAGEVHALTRYLPGVRRAIAENGAVLIEPEENFELLWPDPDRQRLLEFGRQVAHIGPPLEPTGDAFARLVDVAFRRDGRDEASLLAMQNEATAHGIEMVWSSVHIHFSEVVPDKGLAVLEVARRAGVAGAAVATVGDSPNDAGLWCPGRFGLTVGLAASVEDLGAAAWRPRWLAPAAAEGWLELAERIIAARST